MDTPQGCSEQVQKVSPPPGSHIQTVQPVVSQYIKYAIPAHNTILYSQFHATSLYINL